MSAEPLDPTFRNYTSSQANAYAKERGGYASILYTTILQYHASNQCPCNLVLDVGCGPGNATRQIAGCFDSAVGVDPGTQMIANARSLDGATKGGGSIRYKVCAAEKISNVPGLKAGSVDLIIAAMAAHWFDMAQFWREAAIVLKPGGTVALWVHSSLYCHPSTPNAAEVQRILFRLERETLAPYETPSNRLARDIYENLPLPWDVSPQVESFSKEDFVRRTWDCDGVLSRGTAFVGGNDEVTLEELGRQLSTASMVTRWRAANSSLAENDDCVAVTIRELRRALAGQERLVLGSASNLLLFKRMGTVSQNT